MTCFHFASKANDLITIQEAVETDDAYGGRTVTWTTHSQPWAIIEQRTGREIIAQGSVQSRATHVAIIRYNAAYKDIVTTANWRVSFDGRLFAIQGINNYATDMKNHGTAYQKIYLEENGADING